jgi:hypothetical protein
LGLEICSWCFPMSSSYLLFHVLIEEVQVGVEKSGVSWWCCWIWHCLLWLCHNEHIVISVAMCMWVLYRCHSTPSTDSLTSGTHCPSS